MNTYPQTCPSPKEPEITIENEIKVLSYTVSYAEGNQQNTNKNMRNGENSDPRQHCHFEAKTSLNGGNPVFTSM